MLNTKIIQKTLLQQNCRGRIIVAMSGGVDSSCVAALLCEQGYEVIGLTMQLYDINRDRIQQKSYNKSCCAGQDIYDAKRVAAKLNIPHYVLNYEDYFIESVIRDFAESYARGETPIPCVTCNKTMKFYHLLEQARILGADALATGHYIQRFLGENGWELHRGIDNNKDQSYFLYSTTSDQLSYLRFPLGGLRKNATRKLAQRYNLPTANKPDSQDICFVSKQGGYAEIVQKYSKNNLNPGNIVDLQGNIIGQHKGIIFYTVGQRRGINIKGQKRPLYVVEINADRAEIRVGPYEALAVSSIHIDSVNWLTPLHICNVQIQFRSGMLPVSGQITVRDSQTIVVFADPQYGVSTGQACVFYKDSHLLGGGEITQTQKIWTN